MTLSLRWWQGLLVLTGLLGVSNLIAVLWRAAGHNYPAVVFATAGLAAGMGGTTVAFALSRYVRAKRSPKPLSGAYIAAASMACASMVCLWAAIAVKA